MTVAKEMFFGFIAAYGVGAMANRFGEILFATYAPLNGTIECRGCGAVAEEISHSFGSIPPGSDLETRYERFRIQLEERGRPNAFWREAMFLFRRNDLKILLRCPNCSAEVELAQAWVGTVHHHNCGETSRGGKQYATIPLVFRAVQKESVEKMRMVLDGTLKTSSLAQFDSGEWWIDLMFSTIVYGQEGLMSSKHGVRLRLSEITDLKHSDPRVIAMQEIAREVISRFPRE